MAILKHHRCILDVDGIISASCNRCNYHLTLCSRCAITANWSTSVHDAGSGMREFNTGVYRIGIHFRTYFIGELAERIRKTSKLQVTF